MRMFCVLTFPDEVNEGVNNDDDFEEVEVKIEPKVRSFRDEGVDPMASLVPLGKKPLPTALRKGALVMQPVFVLNKKEIIELVE